MSADGFLETAHRAVEDVLTIRGRQVPPALVVKAVRLLDALYTVSAEQGVQPEDWATVASLPTSCVDVVIAVERRPRFDGDPTA